MQKSLSGSMMRSRIFTLSQNIPLQDTYFAKEGNNFTMEKTRKQEPKLTSPVMVQVNTMCFLMFCTEKDTTLLMRYFCQKSV